MTETIITLERAIEALLEQRKFNTIIDILNTMNPSDAAFLLQTFKQDKVALLFRLLSKEMAAEAFVEIDADVQESLISGLTDGELKEIVDVLFLDDAVDLVEEMPANVVKRILLAADPSKRLLINELLKYPEDSAGSIMTTEFVELRADMSAQGAIDQIRRIGINRETVNNCYVTDEKRLLIGVVSLRTLIMADPGAPVGTIMEDHVISAGTHEDQESVAHQFSKYNFTVMPVVDGDGRLVGIVTVDDAMDVLEEETNEDIAKMAAITPSGKPYPRLGVIEIWKSRIPWLLLLMISATVTGWIITRFETALSACIALTAFIPMLMDTGGNSGSQSSVTIIRSLSLDEVHFSDLPRILWKELRVALLCGLTLSAVNFAKLLLLDRVGAAIAAVICIALLGTVLVAKLIGCSLPMLAKKLGFDPAVMASPFITTIVDALSLVIYFSLARALLHL